MKPIYIVALLGSFVLLADSYKAPTEEQIKSKFKNIGHPRILLTKEKKRELQALIRDPIARSVFDRIMRQADKALGEEPAKYELRDGRRLLYVSREVQNRILALGLAWHMKGGDKYRDRIWRELEAVSKFKHWNPAHFLDTAEMCYAMAIGYDWLYDEWSPKQRALIRNAMKEKGFEPAMKCYGKMRGWAVAHHNWNQVCNGCLGLSALAIAEEEPDTAARYLSYVLKGLPNSMRAYAPDGACLEGVGYWGYATRNSVPLLACLDMLLGTDFGLSQVDGYGNSGEFAIYMCGSKRIGFDFADSPARPGSAAQHFWMGKKFNKPQYQWFRYTSLEQGHSSTIYDLFWYDKSAKDFNVNDLPRDKHFRQIECASMRDSWTDGKGFIAALQGGKNKGTHRHLDLGSFILEANGVRFIIDSGKEKESYQRHKNKVKRYDFYRLRAEGHNTLVFDVGQEYDQDMQGNAKFTSFESTKNQAKAVLDLTSAYSKHVSKLSRTFILDREKTFSVIDDITCRKPSEFWSFFHTKAAVSLADDKRSATLKMGGKALKVKLVSPSNAMFQVMNATPLPESPNPKVQNKNKGMRKLAIHMTGVQSTRIEVRFEL